MKKILISMLVVSAMGIAAAMAQPGQGDGQGPKGNKEKHRDGIERMSDKLDLTPEQQKALKDLRQELKGQMIDLRANVEKAKLAVESQMTAEQINRDALMAAVDAESAAELAVKKAMIDHHLKVREIVGAEKAEQMFRHWKDRRGEGMDEGRGRGGEGFGPGGRRGFGPGNGPGPGRDMDNDNDD